MFSGDLTKAQRSERFLLAIGLTLLAIWAGARSYRAVASHAAIGRNESSGSLRSRIRSALSDRCGETAARNRRGIERECEDGGDASRTTAGENGTQEQRGSRAVRDRARFITEQAVNSSNKRPPATLRTHITAEFTSVCQNEGTRTGSQGPIQVHF